MADETTMEIHPEENPEMELEENTDVIENPEEYNPMSELIDMMRETGLPFAYDHFAQGECPDPPFVVYLTPARDDFPADGISYFQIEVVHIELYTDEKNPETERIIEDVLDAHGYFYDRTEVWIESEQLYEVLYSFERKVPVYAKSQQN